MIVHLVRVTFDGPDQIRVYTAACGVPDVLAHFWTVNRDLVTCWKCKQRS